MSLQWTPVPADRWDNAAWYDPRPAIPGELYTRAAGFVDGIGEFDAGFFSLSDSEARFLDPQQRMLLEVTWEALEDAVIVPQSLHGSSTSVHIGVSNPDYSLRCGSIPIGPYVSTGNAFSCVSGRISYTFRLQGPSLSIDTACSASAVCTQLALECLRGRKSSLALAAGNAMLEPSTTIALCQVTALSPNNRTASFGAEADGYSRGEGAAMVVLQRDTVARVSLRWGPRLKTAVIDLTWPKVAVLTRSVVGSPSPSNSRGIRQLPTRLPYSRQHQFSTPDEPRIAVDIEGRKHHLAFQSTPGTGPGVQDLSVDSHSAERACAHHEDQPPLCRRALEGGADWPPVRFTVSCSVTTASTPDG